MTNFHHSRSCVCPDCLEFWAFILGTNNRTPKEMAAVGETICRMLSDETNEENPDA